MDTGFLPAHSRQGNRVFNLAVPNARLFDRTFRKGETQTARAHETKAPHDTQMNDRPYALRSLLPDAPRLKLAASPMQKPLLKPEW